MTAHPQTNVIATREIPSTSFGRTEIAYAVVITITALAVSAIPYVEADRFAQPGQHFIGYYFPAQDIASYFSFVQQAADGEVLFKNNLTYLPNERIFSQPIWVLLGYAMRAMDLSTRAGFALWRIVGAVVLVSGFAALTSITLSYRSHRIVAMTICVFGGGFGWLLCIVSKFGILDISGHYYLQNPAIDLGAPIHAFAHIAKNPHYSLPHGTYLFFWYFFLKADQGPHRSVYCAAACVTGILLGFIRQYDLISLFAVIPLFIVADSIMQRLFDLRRAMFRALPLAAMAPVFAYQIYLFSLHPVFSSSSTQGAQPHVPLHWHVLSLGIAGLMLPWRLYKKPIRSSNELLLLIWAGTLFILFHANGILSALSFSPQVAMSLMSPIILLSVGVLPPIGVGKISSRRALAVNALVVIIACLTTPLYIARAIDDIRQKKEVLYLSGDDLAAITWLREHSPPNSLILSSYRHSNKLCAQLNRRFVLGHWAFSPNCSLLTTVSEAILTGKYRPMPTAQSMLAEYGVNYLVVPAEYHSTPSHYFEHIPGVVLSFISGDVRIFSVEIGRDDFRWDEIDELRGYKK